MQGPRLRDMAPQSPQVLRRTRTGQGALRLLDEMSRTHPTAVMAGGVHDIYSCSFVTGRGVGVGCALECRELVQPCRCCDHLKYRR